MAKARSESNDDALETLLAARKTAERLRGERDRLQGAAEQVRRRLQEEHGAETVEAARKLAAKLAKEAEAAEREFEKARTDFSKKWEGKI